MSTNPLSQIKALIVEAEERYSPFLYGTFDGVRIDGRLEALRECEAIVSARNMKE